MGVLAYSKEGIRVFSYCGTGYHTFSDFKQYPFIISVSVGQKSGHSLDGLSAVSHKTAVKSFSSGARGLLPTNLGVGRIQFLTGTEVLGFCTGYPLHTQFTV